MAVLVAFLVLLSTKPGISQSSDLDNTPVGQFCGRDPLNNREDFIKNRNTTLHELKTQLLSNTEFYARAQSLNDGDSIYAAAQCRNYLSVDQCGACFDAAVSQIINCTDSNGAYAVLDNCFIRYENFAAFYTMPNATKDDGVGISSCGNQSETQQTSFNQRVDGLLSDMRDATPKTSDFYVASMRKISENATVYAIAQCVRNISQAICQDCLNAAYNRLYNCVPNTEGRFFDMACFVRYSATPFFNANQTVDMSSLLKGHSHSSKKVTIIAGATAGVGLLLIMILLLFIFRPLQKSMSIQKDLRDTINYKYKDLQSATNNFSEQNSLGKGGFGEVFKAVLDKENIVAVKKRFEVAGHSKAKEEFENEVRLISNVRHRNLLRLLGWSSDRSHLLVLEYMPNGSLDQFLWGVKRGTLNWKQRFDIISGIARGLSHLHNECHVKIIHRDIKASNILLDHAFQPKIADFGLARFYPEDQSHVSTRFAGTLGYTAPEYALHGTLSDKVDTYSFGIVVLEITSGRRCTDMNLDISSMDYLLERAWRLYENRKHITFIDETLNVNEYEKEHVMQIIEIALMCTQSPASERPTMSEVVLMLPKGQSLVNRQLRRPNLVNGDRRVNIEVPKLSIGTVSGMPKKLIGKE